MATKKATNAKPGEAGHRWQPFEEDHPGIDRDDPNPDPFGPKPAPSPASKGVATFQSGGQTYYAWRDDGVKPTIPPDVEHNIHMILNSDAQHWSTEKP